MRTRVNDHDLLVGGHILVVAIFRLNGDNLGRQPVQAPRIADKGVPGEEKLMGRGVSHCASCDGPLYDGQVVGVVGGGDSALQEALTLANFAEQVVLFHNSEQFSAQNSYRQRVLDNSKIVPRYQSAIEEILGDDVVTGVRVRNVTSGEISQVDLAGLFVYVGLQPNTERVACQVRTW